ncbi:maltose O-acetyltransferase [Salsuginibacillus halophilus]|uniref:Maltose O-acetyltransferase n=1 Tax=Salsuginibacillus halophilus TaxID=517424 RepID=A0A2P8HAN1_9BACI|nr:maltose acetyltransferase domain-containing protein [Salsuginibacillus halophilus]PSL43274.1 maltose O-acetyltransferase [Salsuginibacillus halophilus]
MSAEKEKMLAGELFDPNDETLVLERKRARRLVRQFNEAEEDEGMKRNDTLRQLFGSLGKKVYIEPTFRCDYGYHIDAGDQLFVNYDCVFLDIAPIRFGEGCMVGPGVHIYTVSHPLNAKEYGEPVRIGAHVWIGGGALIMPGVTIGDEAVVAAGAVVTKDVPPNTLVGGNPAKVIQHIDV